jgi:1,4-alpha-glucan branching enzyme
MPVVRFEITEPDAREIFLTGSFNDWHPTAIPMLNLGGGCWVKDLALPPGRYEYLFVVDNLWRPDPAATESVPNPYSGVNSVRVVPG